MNHRYMELRNTLESAYGETFVFHFAGYVGGYAVYCSSVDSARSVTIATGLGFWEAFNLATKLAKGCNYA